MALFAIHNIWLNELVTDGSGVVQVFLPAIGAALWIIGAASFVLINYEDITLGPKKVYIPLLVIVAAIGLSGINASTLKDAVAPIGMGLALFSVYLAVRTLGREVFKPLMIGAVVASLGVIAYAFVDPGVKSGGYVFAGNYDIIVGYVLLGASLYKWRFQWAVVSLAICALILTGSPEALFVMGGMAVVFVILNRVKNQAMYAIIPVIITVGVLFGTGYGDDLYEYTYQVATNQVTVTDEYNPDTGDLVHEIVPGSDGSAIGYRTHVIKQAMLDIKPLGEGYNLTAFEVGTVHNMPLIMVQQLGYPGILAALAFLWVSFYCLFKTRYKYVWALILILCVFDHYIWTQLAPIWWATIGLKDN